MKKMTSKQKMIAGLTTAAIVLSIGVIAVTKQFDKGFTNAPTEDVLAQKRELQLTLDYKSTPKDIYTINLNDESIAINAKDITPEIDTTKIGKVTHSVEVNEENFDIHVTINDSRIVELIGDENFEVDKGMTKENLETMLTEHFTSSEVSEDDKLDLQFTYPQDFDLEKEGEYKDIIITSKFVNNGANKTTKNINVSVVAEDVIEPVEEDVVAQVEKPVEPAKPTPETPKESAKPAPEQPKEPAKPAPEKPSKPAPEKPKEEPKKPAPEKPKEEPIQPKPEKPVEKPVQPKEPEIKEPEFKVPSGVPSDAVLVKEDPAYKFHEFDYIKQISDGAKITNITVSNDHVDKEPRSLITGLDKDGKMISADYTKSGGLTFSFDYPNINQAAVDDIRNLAITFFSYYGY